MVQDRTIVTMADLIESHTRSIEPRHFNDLERPQTQISRSHDAEYPRNGYRYDHIVTMESE